MGGPEGLGSNGGPGKDPGQGHQYNPAETNVSSKPGGGTAFPEKPTSTGDVNMAALPVIDWHQKFSRQQERAGAPFSPGDIIRVPGIVTKDESGNYVIRVDYDGRHADNFHLGAADNCDLLSEHLGLPLTVVIQVREERKAISRLSNVWDYDATFRSVVFRPLTNPSENVVAALSPNTRVVVEGIFQGFKGGSKETSGRSGCWGTVQLDDSRVIRVEFPTGEINFSGGVLENLRGKVPETGDRIAIGAFVTKAEGASAAHLAAHWCDPCILRDSSVVRRTKYETLRSVVNDVITQIQNEIANQNWPGARRWIGEVRKQKLLNPELDRIDRLIEIIPVTERPVLVPRERYDGGIAPHFWVAAIDTAYDVVLESMSKAEFTSFMRTAVTGERVQTGASADTSYLYTIAQEFGIDATTREEILVAALDSRLKKLRGVAYEHDSHFADKYMVDQTLKHLAAIASASSTNKLIDLICDFAANGEFRQKGWQEKPEDESPATFMFEAASALSINWTNLPFETLTENMARLSEVKRTLESCGDEQSAVDDLKRIINGVNQFYAAAIFGNKQSAVDDVKPIIEGDDQISLAE